MGTPLKNPPVCFTLVQVRFNPILKLSEYLPSIQDSMRKLGYPDFETKRDIVININIQDGKPVPSPGADERFCFGTLDKKHRFVLNAQFLTFQSTNYGTYEDFSEKLLRGLSIMHQAVQLDYTDRVGLRYLDHIAPKEGDSLEGYLAQEAQGLSARLGGVPLHSYSETLTTFDQVKLLSRVLIREGVLQFPADLQPEGMEIGERFKHAGGRHAVLDTDGFVEGREIFSLDHVKQQLDTIHEVVRKAFRDAVTEHAFDVWNEK